MLDLVIDLPCPLNQLESLYKIKEIDILYKESSSVATKVVETLQISNETSVDEFIAYEYLSTVPIQTLPETQTTRVYDQVPLRALSQEVIGNRVVYGNYVTINPYPKYLNYKIGVSEKASTSVGAAPLPETTRVEYPNHTLKQNRNYEVGIVLVDKYGRQSPVITADPDLDTITEIAGVKYGGSTIFYPYYNAPGSPINPQVDVLDWCGDSLKILFESALGVPGVRDQGLFNARNPLGWYSYKIVVKQTEQEYYNVYLPGMLDGYPFYNTDQLPDSTAHIVLINDNINKVPRDLREVGPTQQTFSSSVRLSGRVENIATPQVAPTEAPYNSQYYPGAKQDQVSAIGTMVDLKLGTSKFYNLSCDSVAQIFPGAGDYIFVKEYNEDITDRMAVEPLNTPIGLLPTDFPPEVYLEEYSENPEFDSTAISGPTSCRGRFKLYDARTGAPYDSVLNPYRVDAGDTLRITNPYFYNSSGNPLIGRVATENPIGSKMENSTFVVPEFSVYETEATESLLDIFWETTTSGLISDLNAAIKVGGDVEGFDEWSYTQLESFDIGDDVLNSNVQVVDSLSVVVPLTSLTLDSVTSYSSTGSSIDRTTDFALVEPIPGEWNIETTQFFYYGPNAATSQTENYEFTFTATPSNPTLNPVTFVYPGGLSNVKPILTANNIIAPANAGIIGEINSQGNGANLGDVRYTNNLFYEILSQVDSVTNTSVNYFTLSTTGNNLTRNVLANTNVQPGVYEISYKVTDASGFGLSDVIDSTITITAPLLEGGFVTGLASSWLMWEGGQLNWSSTNGYHSLSIPAVDWDTVSAGPIWGIEANTGYGSGSAGGGSFRAVPRNITTIPAPGGTHTEIDSGPYFRGINPKLTGDVLDQNVCGNTNNTSQKYSSTSELPDLRNKIYYTSTTGLTGGTVMFRFQLNMTDGFANRLTNIFQNFIIQYRADSDGAWQEAVDINGDPFRGMIWDFAGNFETYGYNTAVYQIGAAKNNQVRYNRVDSCSATEGNVVNGGSSQRCGGLYEAPVCDISFSSFFSLPPEQMGTATQNAKKSTVGMTGGGVRELPGTINLRNYSNVRPAFIGVCEAERTFVTDAVGEYRIIADNLRQGLAGTDADIGRQSLTVNDCEASNASYLYIEDFNDLDPNGPYYLYRLQNIPYANANEAFAASCDPDQNATFGLTGNNWPNVGTPLELYALEGSFRYVKRFYTRTGTGVPADPYIYEEWNPTSSGWFAYTAPDGVPVDAGIPIGTEKAFGPRKGIAPFFSGCWPVWAVFINLNGSRSNSPIPMSYVSVGSGINPPWYPV